MDVFSLEEDDASDLFITQSSCSQNQEVSNDKSPILGEGFDFGSPLVSVGQEGNFNVSQPHYEDISDDDFEIPSSQKNHESQHDAMEKQAGGRLMSGVVGHGLARVSGINASQGGKMISRLSTKAGVSRRKFNFVSEERIRNLQQIQMKKRTESKCKWALNAYNDWRDDRLRNFNYDVGIYYADLRDLKSLTKENLQHSLCRFIPEVTKSRGEGPYPASTLYQLIVAIQKHLWVNKINWQIVEGHEFTDLKTVLDNVMKERTQANVGVCKRQAEVITYEFEEKMWSDGILGEDSPDILRQTVLYLLGVNLMLCAVDEHYYLRRDMPHKDSQLSVRYNDCGEKCILYQEDTVTKTHDGSLSDNKKPRGFMQSCCCYFLF